MEETATKEAEAAKRPPATELLERDAQPNHAVNRVFADLYTFPPTRVRWQAPTRHEQVRHVGVKVCPYNANDFITLDEERFDLGLVAELIDDPRVEATIDLLSRPEVRCQLAPHSSEDLSNAGRVAIV